MTIPFYVPPEQQMNDRAEFARKGIARGRAVVALRYRDGVCFVAENPSTTLHKVSEIYDRIGFAAVGRYNEFESLRIAGIQQADMRGFTYDRSDVTARSLVNGYAQLLGTVFATADKPYEVELVVAEVAAEASGDRIYRITYDGSVFDEGDHAAMGGSAEAIARLVEAGFDESAPLETAVRLAARALVSGESAPWEGEARQVPLEVAVLDRTRPQRRKFARLSPHQVLTLVRQR